MNNIVITGGMEQPWEIENTDISVPQNIILKNLATAKLAVLGSQAAVQVNAQKDVLQGIVDGMTLLSDRLDELRSPLPWKTNILDLGISDQVGLVLGSIGFDAAKLLAADKMLKDAGLTGFVQNYFEFKHPVSGAVSQKNVSEIRIFSIISPLGGFSSTKFSIPFGTIAFDISRGQYFSFESNNFFDFGDFKLIEDGIKKFGAPRTEDEIISKTSGSQINSAMSYTDSKLIKKTLMYGIEISAEDKKILDDPAAPEEKKLEIQKKYQQNIYANVNVNFDRVRLNIPNVTTGDQYFFFPPKSLFNEDLATVKAGTLYTLSSDTSVPKKYYYSTVSNKKLEVDFNTQMKPFILKPSVEEIQNWRSQIAEKQIQLTQRSSEQQNYLSELVQTHNYAFDAASNLLKMLANADNEIIRNY